MRWYEILAWGAVTAIVGVIVFVRPSQAGGDSGGVQASQIINASANGSASIIKALTGLA